MVRFFVIAALLAAPSLAGAEAQQSMPAGGQGWSVLSGQTVGSGANVVTGQVGWPGITASILRGVTPQLDVGGQASFVYGLEGLVSEPMVPGLRVQGVLRVGLLEAGRVNLGLRFSPGPVFYFHTFGTRVGLALPIGFALGIAPTSALMLHFGLDLPIYVLFSESEVRLPILVGAGAEYFIDRSLSINFIARMGPTLRSYHQAAFTLQIQAGVAYRF